MTALPDVDIGEAMRRDLGLMTPEEVAAAAGLEAKTLRSWRSGRHGPPYVKVGRTVLYRRESLLAWLAAQERRSDGTGLPA